jgi:phage gp45-like
MSKKASVIKFKPAEVSPDSEKRMQLDSGRQIVVSANDREELIRIVEPEGEISVTLRMTDAGPVFTVQGARLEIKSTETLFLEAKKIKIHAQEEAAIDCEGKVKIESAKKMDIRSDDDIRVEGKLIHLN